MQIKTIAIFLLTIVSGTVIFAQQEESQQERTSVFDVDFQQVQRSNEQVIPQQQILEQAFEKAIDPQTYILGPGDQLLIKISGVIEQQVPTAVSPEGYLTPSIIDVYVSGKTLADAAEMIKSALAQTYLNAQFTVRLVKLRKFRVFVVGEVRNPGTYYLRAVDRVSDAIQLAGGLTDWGDDTRIQLRHVDGTLDTVNVNDFYLTGELSNNDVLNGGDVIFIPPINLKENYVIIEGNVGSQGIYQTRPEETLFQFLTRLQAINRRSDIENVVLIRENTRRTFNLLDINTPAREVILQTGDRIIIPSTQNVIYVRGEVRNPGAYGYLANYTAKDYAGRAGILETAKGLDELTVVRAKTGEVVKGEDVIVMSGDLVVVPRRARESFKDILTIITPIISIGISAVALIQASK